jgi:hypothetical protein
MKEIKIFMNEYLFIANLLLFLCYMQSNLIMFRLLFISSCIFFLIFSLTGETISLDTVIFNFLFTIINTILVIPLIKRLVPPEFTKEQKEIFRSHFRNYLSPIELNVLLTSARRKIYRVTTKVVKLGNDFSSLYFVAKIGKRCKVEMKTKKRKFELTEYSWIGVPEYLNVISKKESLSQALKDYDTGDWGVNMQVFVDSYDIVNENLSFDQASETKDFGISMSKDLNPEDSQVIIYEFELNNIEKIFSDSHYGTAIMRGLHSRWLKYCSDIVKKVDATNIEKQNTTNLSLSISAGYNPKNFQSQPKKNLLKANISEEDLTIHEEIEALNNSNN